MMIQFFILMNDDSFLILIIWLLLLNLFMIKLLIVVIQILIVKISNPSSCSSLSSGSPRGEAAGNATRPRDRRAGGREGGAALRGLPAHLVQAGTRRTGMGGFSELIDSSHIFWINSFNSNFRHFVHNRQSFKGIPKSPLSYRTAASTCSRTRGATGRPRRNSSGTSVRTFTNRS